MTESSFTIIETISEGPNAVVYKARQNALNRFVLIKRLQHHLLSEPQAHKRFMREAQAIAMLKSAHIVQIYDVTELEQAPAIVMEYVEGESLEERIRRNEGCDEAAALDVARSVLEALGYAHGRGIIHRDIKPGNILIDGEGRVKLTDFGIASIAAEPSLTSDGSLMGTPAYMSPEQARGEGVDHRTDFFSLGATVYEMCTRRKFFDGATYAECLTKILSFKEEDLRKRIEEVPPLLRPFLLRVMMPEKSARAADAREALRLLDNGAAPPPRRRKWGRVAIAGGSVAVIGAAAMLMTTPARRDEPPASSATDSIAVDTVRTTRPILPGAGSTADGRGTGRESEQLRADTLTVGAPTARLPIPSTAQDSGYLAITCRPWARVFIDSQFIETTPIAGTIRVPAGRHSVTFTNPDFAPIVKSVFVTKNTMSSVNADFVAHSGYLSITVDPWAEVYVDDQYRDTTPLNRPILLSAGRRRLRLHNPGTEDITTTVDVQANDTLRLDFTMHLAERKK